MLRRRRLRAEHLPGLLRRLLRRGAARDTAHHQRKELLRRSRLREPELCRGQVCSAAGSVSVRRRLPREKLPGGDEGRGRPPVPCQFRLQDGDDGAAADRFLSSERVRLLPGVTVDSRRWGGAVAEAARRSPGAWQTTQGNPGLRIVDRGAASASGSELFALPFAQRRNGPVSGRALHPGGFLATAPAGVNKRQTTANSFPLRLTLPSATSFSTIARVFRSAIGQTKDATSS